MFVVAAAVAVLGAVPGTTSENGLDSCTNPIAKIEVTGMTASGCDDFWSGDGDYTIKVYSEKAAPGSNLKPYFCAYTSDNDMAGFSGTQRIPFTICSMSELEKIGSFYRFIDLKWTAYERDYSDKCNGFVSGDDCRAGPFTITALFPVSAQAGYVETETLDIKSDGATYSITFKRTLLRSFAPPPPAPTGYPTGYPAPNGATPTAYPTAYPVTPSTPSPPVEDWCYTDSTRNKIVARSQCSSGIWMCTNKVLDCCCDSQPVEYCWTPDRSQVVPISQCYNRICTNAVCAAAPTPPPTPAPTPAPYRIPPPTAPSNNNNDNNNNKGDDSGTSVGAIVGGVLGGLVLMGLVVGSVLFVRGRQGKMAKATGGHMTTGLDLPLSEAKGEVYTEMDKQIGLAE